MNLNCIFYFVLVVICFQQTILCSPLNSDIHSSDDPSAIVNYRASESQQVEDVQEQISQEPVQQNAIVEEPVQQDVIVEEHVKQEPIEQQHVEQEPIKSTHEITNERTEVECTRPACVKAKPNFSKAITILKKGNLIAKIATIKVAAPAVIKSAKIAALAGLIPVKLAATGAIVGGLIAKPIIITSAIVGATAAKLSYLFVGAPIKVGTKLLAGAEALRAKLVAKKAGCVPSCESCASPCSTD